MDIFFSLPVEVDVGGQTHWPIKSLHFTPIFQQKSYTSFAGSRDIGSVPFHALSTVDDIAI